MSINAVRSMLDEIVYNAVDGVYEMAALHALARGCWDNRNHSDAEIGAAYGAAAERLVHIIVSEEEILAEEAGEHHPQGCHLSGKASGNGCYCWQIDRDPAPLYHEALGMWI